MKNWLNIDKLAQTWRNKLLSIILPATTLFVLLVAWEISVAKMQIEKWILPGPLDILKSGWQIRELIFEHSLQTMLETFIGFGIAVLAGIVIATVIELSPLLKKALYPLLVISQTIPIIAVAPLFLIWFGYGLLPKVVVIALVCFFPITVNLIDGYRMVDRDMVRLLHSMGAGRGRIFWMVRIPSALPFFFSGLRIAGTYSVMGAVIGEWLGASKGLGVLMTRSSHSFLTDRVFATIIVITLLSLAIVAAIELLARITMPWYYRQEERAGQV